MIGLLRRARRRVRGLWPRPVVLMYHRVDEPGVDPWRLSVSPARFESQLRALVRSRRVLPLRELAALNRRGRAPANAVAITFDDGYACNLLNAAPLLAQYGVPATVFLATGFVGSGRAFWSDELVEVVFTSRVSALRLETRDGALGVDLGPIDDAGAMRRWSALQPPRTARQAAYLDLWSVLRNAEPADQELMMSDLRRQAGTDPGGAGARRPLTLDQARSLACSPGIEIGAHTVSHGALSQLSHSEQLQEIAQSRAACERLSGKAIASFAYAYGDYDSTTLSIVEAEGFELACSTHEDVLTPRSHPFALPRLQVMDWDGETLELALRRLGSGLSLPSTDAGQSAGDPPA